MFNIQLFCDIPNIKIYGVNQWTSVNKRYNTIYKTTKYKNFQEELLLQSKPVHITEAGFGVKIEVTTYNDIDSLIKPVLDTIKVKSGIDDRYCQELRVIKHPCKKNATGRLTIYIYELEKKE